MGISAADYTELLTAVLSQHESKLVDQLTTTHPVLDLIANVSTPLDSHSLVMPLEVVPNGTTKVTDGNGTFSTAYEGDLIAAAKYDVGDPIISTAMVPWKILQMSGGKNQVIDLAKTHIAASVKDQKRQISQWLWAPAGTAGRPFDSLFDIVSDETVIGGIDPASAEYWKSLVFTIDVADEPDIRKAIRRVQNRIQKVSGEAPTTLLVSLDVFEEFEDAVLANGRYDYGSAMGTAQTKFREYKSGDLTVRLDVDAPEGTALFVRTDGGALEFRPVAGNFLKPQERQPVVGPTAGKQTLNWIQPLATLGVVGSNERRAHGLIKRTRTGEKANPEL